MRRRRSTRLVAVNLRSIFLCLEYEIRAMLQRGGGSIVNIASTNSFRPLPKQAAYTATKHGVIGLTKTAAIEYAEWASGQRRRAGRHRHSDVAWAVAARGSDEAEVISRMSLVGRCGTRPRSRMPCYGFVRTDRHTPSGTRSRSTAVTWPADLPAPGPRVDDLDIVSPTY